VKLPWQHTLPRGTVDTAVARATSGRRCLLDLHIHPDTGGYGDSSFDGVRRQLVAVRVQPSVYGSRELRLVIVAIAMYEPSLVRMIQRLAAPRIPNSTDPSPTIGDGAFRQCYRLVSVAVPTSVKCIGVSAFEGCKRLVSVTLPDSVTSIRDHAFYGCRSLTSITVPASVTAIDDFAFYGCSSLTSVIIPASVTCIGNRAFSKCSALVAVTLPTATYLDEDVFSSCAPQLIITRA
jgi:hypothetical protein